MVKNLSVFFPAFNEAENIEKTVLNAASVLEKLKIPYEIIVINDGSSDATGQIAEALSAKSPNKIRINSKRLFFIQVIIFANHEL